MVNRWTQWQKEGENCSGRLGKDAASHLDRSTVSADNFRAYPQAEPCSGVGFRRDKGLKQRFPNHWTDSRPGVRHGQPNAGARPIPVFMRVGEPDL